MRTMSNIDNICPLCGGDISLKKYEIVGQDTYQIRPEVVEQATRLVCPYCERKVTQYKQYRLDKSCVLVR